MENQKFPPLHLRPRFLGSKLQKLSPLTLKPRTSSPFRGVDDSQRPLSPRFADGNCQSFLECQFKISNSI